MAFAGARPPTRHGRGSRPFPLRAVAVAQPPTSGVTRSAVFSLFLVPSFPLVSFLVPLISSLFLSFRKFRERERRQPPARSRANCDQNEIGEANGTHGYLFPFLLCLFFPNTRPDDRAIPPRTSDIPRPIARPVIWKKQTKPRKEIN